MPKNPDQNLIWRANLLRAADTDTGLQRDLFTACAQSVLFWVNFAAFTYRVFVTDAAGVTRTCRADEAHVPFVTWPIQDEHILLIERAIDTGFDLLSDKSRDMGATWDHIVVLHHKWVFQDERTFLELSRKEDCVDTLGKGGTKASDPGTLLGKHDYLNRWLPSWMLPLMDRKRMHLINMSNGSRIDGESSNATAGSSDRRTAILLDEMAKMKEGEAIKRSTKDVTACRLGNSTPNGPGTAFSKWRQSGQVKVFALMYWDHPEKGLGRYTQQDESTGKWSIRSPWFDEQEKVRSPREMAIEVLADHLGSGATFFEPNNIEAHRRIHSREPRARYRVDFRKGVASDMIPNILARSQREYVAARKTSKGSLRVWPHLVGGRLDQTKNYVFGIDVSKGQGASNSVISVVCVETREKVAEYADANVPPYELARIACALGLWVGGSRKNGRPLICWEANGPGWDFGRQLVRILQYPFYFVDHSTGVVSEKTGKKYGWHSSREKKEVMLGVLRRAYAHGGFINHSDLALDEALQYVYYDNGAGIGPAGLQEESPEAKKCHGDRVIGDGLALYCLDKSPRAQKTAAHAPMGSIGRRMQQWKRRRKRTSVIDQRRFDHRTGHGDLTDLLDRRRNRAV